MARLFCLFTMVFLFSNFYSENIFACDCSGDNFEHHSACEWTQNCWNEYQYNAGSCYKFRFCQWYFIPHCGAPYEEPAFILEPRQEVERCEKIYNFQNPEAPESPKNNYPKKCGSVINVGALTVGEEVPLVGTDLKLVYHSDRVVGFKDAYSYKQNIDQPTSSSHTVVHISDSYLGSVISNDHLPNTYLEHTFTWNGLDHSSNPMYSSTEVQLKVEYGDGSVRWIQYGRSIVLGGFQSKVIGLGGWMLSNVHFYDLNKKTLYLGNGDSQQARVYYVTENVGNYDSITEVMDGMIPPSGFTNYMVRSSDLSETYLFDLNGFHVKTFSGRTAVEKLNITYDVNHKITSVTDAYNKEIEITRSGSTVSIEAPNGKITTIELDANGWAEEIIDPLNKKHEMTYSTDGLIQTFKNPEGLITSFTYDSMGRLQEDSNTAGHEITFDILSLVPNYGREINSTSKLGRITSYNISY